MPKNKVNSITSNTSITPYNDYLLLGKIHFNNIIKASNDDISNIINYFFIIGNTEYSILQRKILEIKVLRKIKFTKINLRIDRLEKIAYDIYRLEMLNSTGNKINKIELYSRNDDYVIEYV